VVFQPIPLSSPVSFIASLDLITALLKSKWMTAAGFRRFPAFAFLGEVSPVACPGLSEILAVRGGHAPHHTNRSLPFAVSCVIPWTCFGLLTDASIPSRCGCGISTAQPETRIVPMNRREIRRMAASLVHAAMADTKPPTELVEVF